MANDTVTRSEQGLSGLTSAIETLIGTTRRLLRSTWVVTGLAVSSGLFLTLLLAVSLLDLAVPLWPSLRLCGLLLVLVPTVWAAFAGVIRPVFRKLTQVMVARRIEQELPGIHNRLVSCVDFSRAAESRKYSQSFHSRLVHEAYERVREFHPRKVLDLLTLRRAGLFATTSAALFVIVMLLFSDRLPTAVARIFQPFADIPPASGVLYDVLVGDQEEPGDYESLRGEDVVFTIVLTKGEVDPPGGSDPLRLEINLADDDGAPKTLHYEFAELQENRTSFTLTGMQDSFTYRVHGGGTWSRQYSVQMLDRPRIVSLQTAVHFPEYMGILEPVPGLPGMADVSGPRDSTVEVTVDVEGDASEGEIELLQQQSRLVQVTERPERVWFADEYPAGSTAEGQWLYDEELLGQRGHTDTPAAGLHAHGFLGAPIGFELRSGESLFTHVFLSPDDMPEAVMLRFHDGEGWEHRAYWGADKIGEGQADTAGRQYMGELPEAGELVRLEVPAEKLELEGRRIFGVSFALFGGKAVWGPTGSLPPAQKRITELVVTEAALLSPRAPADASADAPAQWSGRFQLTRDGFYRVVLRNKLDYPNQRMQEGELTAIPDAPPQVAIDRPGMNLVVSKPIKVPVSISSYDDFGIDDIVLSVQSGDSEPFQGGPIVKFEQPVRSDIRTVMLDLAKEDLELGETLRYRVVVRDRKGQTATTQDHTIRLADESTAADREIAEMEEQTETLQEKLQELVAQQTEVTEQVDALAEEYESLTEEIEQALEEAADDPDQPADQPPQITLDEESQQELDELRAKMAEIKPLEDQAAQLSQEIASDLQQLAEQSDDQELLPPEVAEQLQGVQAAFEQMAVEPLQELSEMMQAASQPTQPDPQLAEVQEQSRDVQQSLEDLQTRINAIARAQETSRDDVSEAVAELQQDVMQQNAELTARELQELQEFMEAMREDIAELGEEQDELMADAEQDISDQLFEKLVKAQDQLEETSDPVLENVEELLASEMLDDIRPQDAEDEEMTEEDPAGEEPADPPAEDEAEGEDAGEETPDDPPAEPAVADAESEPAEADPADAGEPGDPIREALQERQQELGQELESAEENLAFEQEVLEGLIESLASQLPENAEDSLSQEQAEQLAELMNAESTRAALAMYERLAAMLDEGGESEDPGEPQEAVAAQLPPPAQLNDIGNEDGVIGGVDVILVELEDLDLATRTIIMKMQPREREDLLQGLREDGPEGYRDFIREYFERLTRVRGASSN